MHNFINKKNLVITVFALTLSALAFSTYFVQSQTPRTTSFFNIADFSNDRVLVGVAENVFVAKITDHLSDTSDRGVPETQFSGEIVANVKGNLSGRVIINQFPEDDVVIDDVVIYEPDNTFKYKNPLKPGSTYIFSTLRHPDKNWQTTITHPNAYILVNEDSSLNIEQLKELVRKNKRYIELIEALKNPISLEELDRQGREAAE